jgi:hypothetical protein
MADLLAFIANAFQIGDGFDGRNDHAQVPGRGRARGQDAAALLVDRDLHAVDLVIILGHGASEHAVAVDQCGQAAAQLLLDESAHGQHLGAYAFEFLVETLGSVVREIGGFHDASLTARRTATRRSTQYSASTGSCTRCMSQLHEYCRGVQYSSRKHSSARSTRSLGK